MFLKEVSYAQHDCKNTLNILCKSKYISLTVLSELGLL